MIKELYGTLAHYREMAEKNTKEQVTKGFVCREDAAELVEIAWSLQKNAGWNKKITNRYSRLLNRIKVAVHRK